MLLRYLFPRFPWNLTVPMMIPFKDWCSLALTTLNLVPFVIDLFEKNAKCCGSSDSSCGLCWNFACCVMMIYSTDQKQDERRV